MRATESSKSIIATQVVKTTGSRKCLRKEAVFFRQCENRRALFGGFLGVNSAVHPAVHFRRAFNTESARSAHRMTANGLTAC